MVWIILGALLVIAVIAGAIGSMEITIGFEFNLLNSPFYKIGLFSTRHSLEDGTYEHELTIGLFFVNIVLVFWKEEK